MKTLLAQSEPVVPGSTGQPVVNPLITALREHRKLADRLTLALAVPVGDEMEGRRHSTSARQAARTRWQRGAA